MGAFSLKLLIAPSGETTDRITKVRGCKKGTYLLYHRATYGGDRGSRAGCRRKSVIIPKNYHFSRFWGCKPTFLKPQRWNLARGCKPGTPFPKPNFVKQKLVKKVTPVWQIYTKNTNYGDFGGCRPTFVVLISASSNPLIGSIILLNQRFSTPLTIFTLLQIAASLHCSCHLILVPPLTLSIIPSS